MTFNINYYFTVVQYDQISSPWSWSNEELFRVLQSILCISSPVESTHVLNTSSSATVDNGCQLILLCQVTNDFNVQTLRELYVFCTVRRDFRPDSESLSSVYSVQSKFQENPIHNSEVDCTSRHCESVTDYTVFQSYCCGVDHAQVYGILQMSV